MKSKTKREPMPDGFDDGIPAFLKLTPEERKAGWERHPPRAMPAFTTERSVDPATAAFAAELAAQKKLKTKARISRMLAPKVDTQGKRWDSRTCKWVAMENKMNDTDKAAATGTPEAETKTQETTVAKKAKKAKGKKPATKTRAKGNGGVRPGSKLEVIANLLKRKSGCTQEEAAKAVGWAAVSMGLQAKNAGLKLRKEKNKDGVTRYYGE